MSLITQRSQIELAIAAKDTRIEECAQAAHHLATVLNGANIWFWSRPTEVLLGLLNADVQKTLATFASNTSLGQAINASLDAANVLDESGQPRFPTRAPVEMGRSDIAFDGTEFVLIQPPAPEATPPAELANEAIADTQPESLD